MSKRPALRDVESVLAVSGWPLRRKMSLALAVPLLLAGTLGMLRVQADLVSSSNSASSARQVTVLRPAVAYLAAAEQATVAVVGTDAGSRATLARAIEDLRATAEELRAAKESAELTPAQADQVDAVLDLTRAMRDGEAGELSPGTWQAGLRQLQSGVTQLVTTITNAQITPEPKLDLLSQALTGRFSLAVEQALAAADTSGKAGSTELYSELGAEGAAIDRLATGLGADQKAVAALRSANAERFRTVRLGKADLGGVEAYADYDRTIASLQDSIDGELSTAAADARSAAIVNAIVTIGVVVAAVLLALLVSMLLLKPIRTVRESALAVAHRKLPDAVARIRAGEEPDEVTPIDVATTEEIGQLARAVDDLHRQAVVLASGEAEVRSQVSQMFVTLSRRNTSLINQQLSQIERLERDEEDPKRLDSLFQLDHLAARMRRTADSLLILADAPTASAVVEGLTVSDALQAATSGVQDYQRVRIGEADAIPVSAAAAADVIHLLTELVDNALAYSPPTAMVDVRTSTTARGLVVEIADAGLGIPPDQLMRINHTLASGGEVTPETARRMGLFVVSRLSLRHGVITTLRGNPEGGTTAVVLLPRAILPGLTASGISPLAEAAAARVPEVVEPARVPFQRPLSMAPDAPSVAVEPAEEPELPPAPLSVVEHRTDPPPGLPNRSSQAPQAPAAAVLPSGLPQRGTLPEPVAPALEPLVAPTMELAALAAVAQTADLAEIAEIASSAPEQSAPEQSAPEPSAPEPSAPEPHEQHTTEPEPSPPAVPVLRVVPPPAPEPTVPEQADTFRPRTIVASNALDADWSDAGEDDFDSPIFKELRSAWFSGDDSGPWRTTEIEAGWEKAEEVAAAPVAAVTSSSGLPVRRPGTRLVPGGVEPTPIRAVRDPEAIRARLAAHSSGVARGRRDAADAQTESL